jgi:CheY-like chemotaxis protein
MDTNKSTRFGASEKLPARILYVGGDPYANQAPIRFLISCGVEVTAVSNGEEALSLVETGKDQFDVVITDHDMPRPGRLDAIGLVTKLRFVCYPGMIVILSENAGSAELLSYEPLRVDRILRKPVMLWELRQCLSRQTSTR